MGLLRQIRAAGLILVLAFLAAGCGRGNDNKGKEPSEAENKKPKDNVPVVEKKKVADSGKQVGKKNIPPKPVIPDNPSDDPEDMNPLPVVDNPPKIKKDPTVVAAHQPDDKLPGIDKGPKVIDNKKPTPKEPPKEITEIGGKTIELWIFELNNSKDPVKVEEAVGAIMNFPLEKAYKAVPVLLKMLEDHRYENPLDISLRAKIIPSVGILLDSALQQERAKFEKVKSELKKDLKDLKKEDMDRRMKEINRVTKDVNRGLKVFTSKMLSDEQLSVRIQTLQTLARFGPVAKESTGEILKNLKEEGSWEVRGAAALSLGPIAFNPEGPDQIIIEALVSALINDSCSQVRAAASQTIIALGPPADKKGKITLDLALRNAALNETEVPVKIGMYMALASLDGPNAQSGINHLVGFLHDKDDAIRGQTMHSIALLGAIFTSKNKLPAKAKLDRAVLDAAEKESDPKKRIPLLTYLVTPTPKPDVKSPPEPADSATVIAAIKLLAKHLEDKELDVRLQAVRGLGIAGERAQSAVPNLIQAINKETDFKIQIPWLSILATIEGPEPKEGVKRLIDFLGDKELPRRIQAVRGLAAVGDRAKEAIPKLVENLFGKHPELYRPSIQALAAMGKSAKSAVIDLKRFAEDKKLGDRLLASLKEEEAKKTKAELVEATVNSLQQDALNAISIIEGRPATPPPETKEPPKAN